jgi:hypothetical protein
MVKKISRVSGFGAFLIFSLLAPAQTGSGHLDASALGALEGALNFCTKINPQSAAQYSEMDQILTNGQTDYQVAQMRKSWPYKETQKKVTKELETLPTNQALATCQADASGK